VGLPFSRYKLLLKYFLFVSEALLFFDQIFLRYSEWFGLFVGQLHDFELFPHSVDRYVSPIPYHLYSRHLNPEEQPCYHCWIDAYCVELNIPVFEVLSS
jgi:hypothetical protein